MTATYTPTALERIADEIESWGDGWHRIADIDHVARIRITRSYKDDSGIIVNIEVAIEGGKPFFMIGTEVKLPTGKWVNVSSSVHNPINRRAIDYINEQLDALEQENLT